MKYVISIILCFLFAPVQALSPSVPINGQCVVQGSQYLQGYSGQDVLACENQETQQWVDTLNNKYYNGHPCYDPPWLTYVYIDGTYWEPVTLYKNGQYYNEWEYSAWLWGFGNDSDTQAGYGSPTFNCPFVLGQDPVNPTPLAAGGISGPCVYGAVGQSGCIIYTAAAMQCPQNAHQITSLRDFTCDCNVIGGIQYEWSGTWQWNYGKCAPPDVIENVASVTIDPGCSYIQRTGAWVMYDHRTIQTTGNPGDPVLVSVSTHQFIPDTGSPMYDGAGHRASFYGNWTQFHRTQNSAGWVIWAVFQVPSDSTSLQLFLHSDSCSSTEVSYTLGACKPGTPGC